MAKWHGVIGFSTPKETVPGVWKNQITERNYSGDLNRNSRRLQSADQLNDNIIFANEISIVADPFAKDNFSSILYIEIMGTKWNVSSVEVRYPRLILTSGGIYNGEQA